MKRNLIKATLLLLALLCVTLLAVSCGHTHLFSEMKVLKAPTCTEEGEIEYTCECGYSKIDKMEAQDHVVGSWETSAYASCTEDGSKSSFCKNCDAKIATEVIPATGHDIVSVDAKSATCSEVGYKAYEFCTKCNYTTYKEVDKIAHTEGKAATCTEPQLCKVCECEIAPALGHVRVVTAGKEATCEKTGLSDLVECSRCETVIEEQITIPLREHVPATVSGYAATCTEEGLSDGVICIVCEEELVSQIDLPVNNEHNYGTSRYCKDCEYDSKSKCDHEDDDEESLLKTIRAKSATCSKYGLTAGEYCTECLYVTEEPELVETAEHNIEIIEGYPATMTKPGLTDGEYCKKCKQIVKQQEVIPVISVSIEEEAAINEANGGKLAYTVNEDGKTCTVTGIGTCTAKNIVIPTSIDTYRVTVIGKSAFYTETGIVSVTIPDSVDVIEGKAFGSCTKLTKVKLSDSIEVDDAAFSGSNSVELEYTHTLVYVSKLEAECDEPGRKAHYVCVYCNNRFTDKAATEPIYKIQVSISHDFDDDDVCEECGDKHEEVYIVAMDSIDDKSVKLGTPVKNLKLPATVNAETEDGETHTLSIVWDTSAYKGNVVGNYEVTGYVLTGGYELNRKVDNEITITVKVK